MTTKLNITPSKDWFIYTHPKTSIISIKATFEHLRKEPFTVCTIGESTSESWGIINKELSQLFAEAGTVANETGLMPSQLSNHRTLLLDALKELDNHIVAVSGDLLGQLNPNAGKALRTLIQNAITKTS